MHDYIIASVKAKIDILKELFLAEGKTIQQKGWKEAHNWDTRLPKALPPLTANQHLTVVKISSQKQPTKPPKRLSDSDLLLMMERSSIGTKSSRPDIIKKLIDRNYVIRTRQALISTDWGRALIASLSPIWPEVVTPSFTGKVEQLMNEVATGKQPFPDMLTTLRKEYIGLHQKLIGNIENYQKLLLNLNLSSQSTKSTTKNPGMLVLLQEQFNILPKAPEIIDND